MQFNSCKHDTTAQMKEINTFNKQVCIKIIKSDSKVFCIFTYLHISYKCCSFELSIHCIILFFR